MKPFYLSCIMFVLVCSQYISAQQIDTVQVREIINLREQILKLQNETIRLDNELQKMKNEVAEGIEFAKLISSLNEEEEETVPEEQFSRLREESQASLDDYPELDEFRRSMDEAELAAADFDSDELQLVMRENEELMEDIRFMDDSGLVPQSLMNDINEADSLIQKAENSYEPATRAAAECLIGTAR